VLRRRRPLVVAVALANKTACIAWAVMLREKEGDASRPRHILEGWAELMHSKLWKLNVAERIQSRLDQSGPRKGGEVPPTLLAVLL
jgi:hypothetical protein